MKPYLTLTCVFMKPEKNLHKFEDVLKLIINYLIFLKSEMMCGKHADSKSGSECAVEECLNHFFLLLAIQCQS
jgi:hypothetical protein